jgi:competence transcription factor ComK
VCLLLREYFPTASAIEENCKVIFELCIKLRENDANYKVKVKISLLQAMEAHRVARG